ncbi:MAG: porin [Pseudorhodoplanes sp.]|uniref:porin n=1 Tax=Pseudorhodoplanes sp. TaxID=1934341 RepID=UPI003D14BE0A
MTGTDFKRLPLAVAATMLCAMPAQGAGGPVAARAVDYVRACSLYGVGYYYLPGTETCIKLGGYVRYEAYHNAAGGTYPTTTAQGVMNRNTATFAAQARFRLSTDIRTQTEYGTLRSYVSFGVNWLNNPGGAFESASHVTIALERAFVQFAGFTVGRADTFFAFYSSPPYTFLTFSFDGSTGNTGMNVFAFTHEFGNGLSATISLEDQIAHGAPVIDLGRANAVTSTAGVMGAGLFAQPGAPFSDMRGQWVPDIVANVRLHQSWGGVQIKAALHRVGAGYNFSGPAGAGCSAPNTTVCAHPDDVWGFAAGAGIRLNLPWTSNDTLSGVIAYSQGASRYVAFSQNANALQGASGLALGPFTDAVFGGAGADGGAQSDLLLTRAVGGSAALEHYWTPNLRTAFVFGYLSMSYSEAAKVQIANLGQRCALGGAATTAFNVRNCDPDWSAWRVAARTMWTPVANFDVGLEVGYSRIDTAFAGEASIPAGAGNPNGTGLSHGRYAIADQGVWTATVRVQRSFWP